MNWYFTLQYTVKPPECYSYYFSDVTTESLHIRETKVPLLRPTHWMGPGESTDKRHPSLSAGWVRGAQAMPILWMWRPTGAWHGSSPVPTPGFPSNQGLKKAHLFFPFAPRRNRVTVRTIASLSTVTDLLLNLDSVWSNTPAFRVQTLSYCQPHLSCTPGRLKPF